MIPYTRVRIYFASKYFDFQDIENPIKSFLDFRSESVLDKNLTTYVTGYLQKDYYKLQDEYLQFGKGKTGTFYSMENIDRYTTTRQGSSIYYTFDLYQASKSYHYNRKVLSLVEILGQIGGTHEITMLILSIIVCYYNRKVFAMRLLKRVWESRIIQYQEAEISIPSENLDISDEKDMGEDIKKGIPEPSNSYLIPVGQSRIDEESKLYNYKYKVNISRSYLYENEGGQQEIQNQNSVQAKKNKQEIRARRIPTKDYLYHLFCLKCRPTNVCKTRGLSAYDRYLRYK